MNADCPETRFAESRTQRQYSSQLKQPAVTPPAGVWIETPNPAGGNRPYETSLARQVGGLLDDFEMTNW